MIPKNLMMGAALQPAPGGDEVSIAYNANYTNTGSGASQTFNSVTLPSPETGRLVAITIHAEAAGGATINSVTIAGNSATINSQIVGDRAITGIASIVDDTNAGGQIVVTFDSSVLRCTIGVWTVRDYDSATPSDSDTQTADPSTGLSFTLNIPAGGGAICAQTNGNDNTPMTWTGATEGFDFNSGNTTTQYSGADVQPTGSNRSTHSVTTSHSSSGQGSAGVCVVWSKAGIGPSTFVFNDTVSSDILDDQYNVANEATIGGWNGTDVVEATITVNARIRGPKRTGSDVAAFDTGSLPAGSTVDVTVTNGDEIWGGGGAGGLGGDGPTGGGLTGKTGATAMNFQCDGSVTINSTGEVGGGSGGGGGGGGGVFMSENVTGGTGGDCWPSAGSDTLGEDGGGGIGSSGAGGDGGDKNDSPNSPTAGEAGASSSGGGPGSQGIGIKKNGNTVNVTANGTLFGNPAQQA